MKRVFGKLSKMRGSILAYTLILLGIVLTASMGMFMSSMRDLRSVGTQNRSMQAFQIANSGSEMAVAAIKKNPTPSNLNGLASQIGGGVICDSATGEIVKGTNPPYYLGGEARLSFLDKVGDKITDCGTSISEIASVKSVGTFKETARAVEVAVAASPCDTPGQVVRVASGSSESFSAGDLSKWNSFATDPSKQIVGFHCVAGGSIFSSNAVIVNHNNPGNLAVTDAASGYSLFCQLGTCRFSGGLNPPCSNGWAIYGICTIPN